MVSIIRWSSSSRISLAVASSRNSARGFCLLALASKGASSRRSSSKSYVASKLVFSLEGVKTGSISFLSKASKSMSAKKMCDVKVSKPVAPIRLLRSFSIKADMARRQGMDTAGFVA